MSRYKTDPFLYSEEEKKVLKDLIIHDTPLKISKSTNIPRSSVYFVLNRLKNRGLVKNEKIGKKYFWHLKNQDVTDSDSSKISGAINIYDSKELVRDFLTKAVFNDNERFKTLSGDNITGGWDKHVGRDEIIEFNNYIKKNNLISDHLTSEKPLKEHIELWGEEWINSFQEKPTEYHALNKKYTDHGAQIFIKNKKIYIINMNDPLIVEIKDPEISKMFSLIFEFMKDHSKKVNVSEFLKSLKQ